MSSSDYQKSIKESMEMLGKNKEVIFLGQTTEYPGSPMFKSLEKVKPNKKKEMPVFEDTQLGMSIGLALNGFIPVSIFPRIDFLICATNQLVNHLDKVEEMSNGEFCPGVIIRTQIGNKKPLYPGAQHCGDYTRGLKSMLKHILVLSPKTPEEVKLNYLEAFERAKNGLSTLIIEKPTGVFK
jgi:pyruvate/2-oxoglutarate/acetoin dehydrogenase E1 component